MTKITKLVGGDFYSAAERVCVFHESVNCGFHEKFSVTMLYMYVYAAKYMLGI